MKKRYKIKKSFTLFTVIILMLIVIGIIYTVAYNLLNISNDTKDMNYNSSESSTLSETQNTTSSNNWNLILVNPWNRLPNNFKIELTLLSNGHSIDKRAYSNLQKMMDDCRNQGLSPVICSSYRTTEKQQSLYNQEVRGYISQGNDKKTAEAKAAMWVAIPGTSEHQTGLAVDIVAKSYQTLDKKQENTAEQKWLMKNSYKYGFILRFPSDKSELTGINYEPWHYRYVGEKAAKEIYEKKICLEEYLKSLNNNNNKNSDSITNNKLILVNSDHPLSKNYTVDLVNIDNKKGVTVQVAKEINESLIDLMKEAENSNIKLCINAAYRSYEQQQKLFDERVNKYVNEGLSTTLAKAQTIKWVALPGESEHETGLAIDFGVLGDTTWEQGYSWLEKNAFKFGFIYRYPKDKINITKISNEPWHYRYVGIDAAKEMKEKKICLEEYLK
ncbi:M15 family metallopeptidase [Paludicola sp. MB14-C6]|uniref:M15 family metallopeptidase n=1 Tax=Paludihabitans sp. MB14-C6 TaxID=3070656 RepID=UPI0027DB22B2|nr:M15 family metallopeptidase [Paludicola sp. MB14-C6]WMJ23834.1 M15 family metallopeptidase [Paludicola sp. MB14-C6]